jgi:proteasome accessory factor B
VAARVVATTWHESQEVRALPNGGVELRLVIAEPTEIRPWILGWGQECEVVAPPELRRSILAELEEATAAYGKHVVPRSMAG